MKFKNKSIADLQINWTFIEADLTNSIDQIKSKFKNKNPSISNLKVLYERYKFKFENYEFYVTSGFTNEDDNESLCEFFEWLNYRFWDTFQREVKLSHFERIAENEFIIHEKK